MYGCPVPRDLGCAPTPTARLLTPPRPTLPCSARPAPVPSPPGSAMLDGRTGDWWVGPWVGCAASGAGGPPAVRGNAMPQWLASQLAKSMYQGPMQHAAGADDPAPVAPALRAL
jgi:hypothetical protein